MVPAMSHLWELAWSTTDRLQLALKSTTTFWPIKGASIIIPTKKTMLISNSIRGRSQTTLVNRHFILFFNFKEALLIWKCFYFSFNCWLWCGCSDRREVLDCEELVGRVVGRVRLFSNSSRHWRVLDRVDCCRGRHYSKRIKNQKHSPPKHTI